MLAAQLETYSISLMLNEVCFVNLQDKVIRIRARVSVHAALAHVMLHIAHGQWVPCAIKGLIVRMPRGVRITVRHINEVAGRGCVLPIDVNGPKKKNTACICE